MKTRLPYQPPQTSMERHVAELVEKLEHGIDNRGGFNRAIESAMAHAFWLEAECERLHKDNRELEDAMAVGMPSLASYCHEKPMGVQRLHSIEWSLEPVRWRGLVKPFQSQADEKTWRRIRRATFRQLLGLVRQQFEKTFPLTPNFGGRQ